MNYINPQLNDNNIIEVYPNPVKDILNIKLKNTLAYKNCSIGIYNMEGKIFYEDVFKTNELKIDLQPLYIKSGIYWLIIQDENRKYYKKIIVK